MINFRKLQAVIWDMDGVLVDSEPIHIDTWKIVFRKFGMNISTAQLKRSFGMTSKMTIQTLSEKQLSKENVAMMIKEKARLFQDEIKEKAMIFPGVQGWLESFKNNGVLQALASSGTSRNIEIVMDKLRIGDYFDVVINGDGMPSKPAPVIFTKAADELGVVPLNCLVIEDSVAGVQAAKAAGMKCVAVATTNPSDKLSDANIVVENLAKLKTDQVREMFFA